jgi:hypothetical protein
MVLLQKHRQKGRRLTYTTCHERLTGLDMSSELALVGNGIRILAHRDKCTWMGTLRIGKWRIYFYNDIRSVECDFRERS